VSTRVCRAPAVVATGREPATVAQGRSRVPSVGLPATGAAACQRRTRSWSAGRRGDRRGRPRRARPTGPGWSPHAVLPRVRRAGEPQAGAAGDARAPAITALPLRRAPPAAGVLPGHLPDQLWHLDMTTVRTAAHASVYRHAIVDCCTREVPGWSLELRCRDDEPIAVVQRAVLPRGDGPGRLTLGSDNASSPGETSASTRPPAASPTAGGYRGPGEPPVQEALRVAGLRARSARSLPRFHLFLVETVPKANLRCSGSYFATTRTGSPGKGPMPARIPLSRKG
jgi:putative transposase